MISLRVNLLHGKERTIFWTLCSISLLSVVLYAIFLQGAVRAVVERKQALEDQVVMAARVTELEARYISLQSSLDLQYAYTHGYVDADRTAYVSRQPFDKALTLQAVP